MGKAGTISIVVVVAIVIVVGMFVYTESAQRKAFEDVQISFVDVGIKNAGFTSATLDLVIQMHNPNNITATLDSTNYNIWMNNNYLGNGVIFERVDIPPFSTRNVHTDFEVSYLGVAASVVDALLGGQTTWRMSGVAYYDTVFGTIDVPFDSTF